MLPWWLGSILAVVAYALLHRYASADLPIHAPAGQIGQMVVSQMAKALAFYAQFIVPLVFLAGAATSFCKRRKREDLFRVFWGCTAFPKCRGIRAIEPNFGKRQAFEPQAPGFVRRAPEKMARVASVAALHFAQKAWPRRLFCLPGEQQSSPGRFAAAKVEQQALRLRQCAPGRRRKGAGEERRGLPIEAGVSRGQFAGGCSRRQAAAAKRGRALRGHARSGLGFSPGQGEGPELTKMPKNGYRKPRQSAISRLHCQAASGLLGAATAHGFRWLEHGGVVRRAFCRAFAERSHECLRHEKTAKKLQKSCTKNTAVRYSCIRCSEFDQPIPIEESVTMNRIQKLFEQIAGVYQAETQRWAVAQEIFTAPRMDVSALQKPACWRRKARIYGARR
ncbi:hypothetical protein E4Q23_16650 [Candidatus Accumulibacter phosphatis]|uniref:Ig-like domain-containing protein n=2 Tax=Candidatus Accumulibacter TaxID=327159 RepID=A0ABX1TY95_9PROT|nr:hypothetical protein [Candidatus Accumulibacter phosphatis]NMQ29246.1 hypothetical protein [Candidatus Accumulibacter phosphatis]